jgi:hypothetical protein
MHQVVLEGFLSKLRKHGLRDKVSCLYKHHYQLQKLLLLLLKLNILTACLTATSYCTAVACKAVAKYMLYTTTAQRTLRYLLTRCTYSHAHWLY